LQVNNDLIMVVTGAQFCMFCKIKCSKNAIVLLCFLPGSLGNARDLIFLSWQDVSTNEMFSREQKEFVEENFPRPDCTSSN
jgi:hypothetical protein